MLGREVRIMFSNSVHPKGFLDAFYFAVTGYSYYIVLAIIIALLAIVTLSR